MKSTKLAKSWKRITTMALILAMAVMLMGISSSYGSTASSDENDDHGIKDLGLNTGTLRMIEEHKDASGNTIQQFRDDCYSYYFNPARKEIIVIVAQEDVMEQIVKASSASSMERTPHVNIDIMDSIQKFFPEYNLDTVKIDLDTESGSPVEFYQYTIFDYQNGIQLNKAQISYAYDGQLTFVCGSHNQLDSRKENIKISESDAVSIAFSYLANTKDSYENNGSSDLFERPADEAITATQDMVLPDGVSVGDTFQPEKLPAYEIFLNDQSDMNVIKSEKLVYEDTVAWFIEFIVRTSWGEYDTIFNPLIHIYIDASTGAVLEMNMTDGI